ncbi:volume-regulated anion channel subunit LRRC8D-like [Hyperolius riggenbachi]|uniref:volume-regulated anion channel subunit LRRC8D-like n=1 Tax=Hyperolius riggenbachi TaxID=752182 RepID=UPI0035A37D96
MPEIQWLQLPQEVLLHIFAYLSPTEKANVRATCTYLRTLVDHPSLWKHSTIIFKSIGGFNARFWDTLQSRKISSVEVTRVTLKQFKKMTSSLPDLTSVTMDSCLKGEILQGLRPLVNLQQLHLTDCSSVTDQDIFSEIALLQQLTHLSLCRVTFSGVLPLTSIVLLQNLYSLSLHSKEGNIPERALQYILFRLPKLRELSLAVGSMNKWKLSLCFNVPDNFVSTAEDEPCISRLQLHKLELLNSACASLSSNAFDQLSTLRSVCLRHYKSLQHEELIETLLTKLPQLTELRIEWAAPFVPIMGPIPCKLEKLSMVGTKISNATLNWIARSAGQLKCLNLSYSHGYDQEMVKSFPRLFPHLQNLYLSNTRLSEEALVVLANLYSLRVLDISNNLHLTSETILAFRKMTSNRIGLILERPIDSMKYCCW